MITNADITIYNRKYDRSTRTDSWQRTVIRGVSYYHDRKAVLGDKGLTQSEIFRIRIPASVEGADNYLDEEDFFNSSDPSGKWTLQDGDIIVEGICEKEIERPVDLTELHYRTCKITDWSDNRRGSVPHWRIGGE